MARRMLTPKPNPRPFLPKPRRLLQRKRMTLIAAFWCAEEQAVLCADSQETWGQYKTSVDKIMPQRIGRYEVAYGGSGLADFVDGIGDALESGLERSRARDMRTLQKEIQTILTAFYASEPIKAYPVDWNDANTAVSGVICIRVIRSSSVFLFRFSKTVVLPVRDFVLRGIEEPIYQHIAKRLYRPTLNVLQAELLGIHLLTEAGSTSTQIGGETRVVFAMLHGMYAEERSEALKLYEEGVANVERVMDDLFLECADTQTVSDARLRVRLKEFIRTIRKVREERGVRIAKVMTTYFHTVGHPLMKPSFARKYGYPVHPLALQRTKRDRKSRPPSLA
jgi:hypothetical protein